MFFAAKYFGRVTGEVIQCSVQNKAICMLWKTIPFGPWLTIITFDHSDTYFIKQMASGKLVE